MCLQSVFKYIYNILTHSSIRISNDNINFKEKCVCVSSCVFSSNMSVTMVFDPFTNSHSLVNLAEIWAQHILCGLAKWQFDKAAS